jgi:hypothetical protein
VLPGWISKHTIFYQRLLLGNMRNLLFVFSFFTVLSLVLSVESKRKTC